MQKLAPCDHDGCTLTGCLQSQPAIPTPKKQPTNLRGVVVAVDFDGTCVTHEFPNVGREIGAPPVLRRMVDAGAKLILWTMRSNGRTATHARNGKPYPGPNLLDDAVAWFDKHGIPLYGVLRNPTQDSWTTSPKAYAQIYIDDAALGCPLTTSAPGERPHVDWEAVEAMLFGTQNETPCHNSHRNQ
jgi:hypothetical protein